MDRKPRRPQIPPQTQRELWARAAGRCQFRGCNKLLYRDLLTKRRSNLASLSHVVSWTPDGPRGDPAKSSLLATDIHNLILTCREHGKIVDDHDKVDEYPEELLLEFKREHEQRVRIATGVTEEAQTHVLLVQVPIDGRSFMIDEKLAYRAIMPRYPAEEEPWVIDLAGVGTAAQSDGFFSHTATVIEEGLKPLLRRRFVGNPIKNISVFALAPVPLLFHLGHLLGDIERVDLYQRHRGRQDWSWHQEEQAQQFYETLIPRREGTEKSEIALVLSISGRISQTRVRETVGDDALIYEIQAVDPGRDFLHSRKRLEVFGYEVRKLLDDLRERYQHYRRVHVFAAVPSPAAIEFGRNIKAFDPPFVIYEYEKGKRRYTPALTINEKRS